jgi:hypothetical protein
VDGEAGVGHQFSLPRKRTGRRAQQHMAYGLPYSLGLAGTVRHLGKERAGHSLRRAPGRAPASLLVGSCVSRCRPKGTASEMRSPLACQPSTSGTRNVASFTARTCGWSAAVAGWQRPGSGGGGGKGGGEGGGALVRLRGARAARTSSLTLSASVSNPRCSCKVRTPWQRHGTG